VTGVELNTVAVRGSIEPYILLQIIGRTLRLDYAEKEGWCRVFKVGEGTADAFLYEVFRRFMHDYGLSVKEGGAERPTQEEIVDVVRRWFGQVDVDGMSLSTDETARIIHRMFLREYYERRLPTYDNVRRENVRMQILTRAAYRSEVVRSTHPLYVSDPQLTFATSWSTWYNFLGRDTSAYPPTKHEFVNACIQRGLKTYQQFKNYIKDHKDLPEDPVDMYGGFKDWDTEISNGKKDHEEIVW
jgi:hypothetical protein